MIADTIREIKLDVFQKQSEIIKLQSDIIDGLFTTLLMHMEISEIDNLSEIKKINDVAKMKIKIEL